MTWGSNLTYISSNEIHWLIDGHPWATLPSPLNFLYLTGPVAGDPPPEVGAAVDEALFDEVDEVLAETVGFGVATTDTDVETAGTLTDAELDAAATTVAGCHCPSSNVVTAR